LVELVLLKMTTGKTTVTAMATTMTPITRGFVCQGKPLSGGLELSEGRGEAINVDEGLEVATGVLEDEEAELEEELAEGFWDDEGKIWEGLEVTVELELGKELDVEVGDWVGVGVGPFELILLSIAYLAALMITPLVLSLIFVIILPF
jgi:hypothetical protein